MNRKSQLDRPRGEPLSRAMVDELSRQIAEMKAQINRDLVEDLNKLREVITKDIMDAVQEYLNQELARFRRASNNNDAVIQDVKKEVMAELDRKIENVNNQIVVSNNKQISVTKQLTKELTGAITAATSKKVYEAVITEINEKIVPKVNDMVQYINYQTQDTSELITDYRRAVELDSRGSDIKLLASSRGEDKKSWAGGAVRMMWDNDDSVT